MTKGNSRGVRVEGRDVLYGDEDITVYAAEGMEALRQDGGHLIIVVDRHMESVNEMVSAGSRRGANWADECASGPSDIPLLSHIIDTGRRLLKTSSPATGPAVTVRFVGTLVSKYLPAWLVCSSSYEASRQEAPTDRS